MMLGWSHTANQLNSGKFVPTQEKMRTKTIFSTSVKNVFFKANVEPDVVLPYCLAVSFIVLYFGRGLL